jgi:hypothetical protein
MSNNTVVDKRVRILIDKDGILIRAGDPDYHHKEIDKEILNIVKDGGSVRNISFEQYQKLNLYEKVTDSL